MDATCTASMLPGSETLEDEGARRADTTLTVAIWPDSSSVAALSSACLLSRGARPIAASMASNRTPSDINRPARTRGRAGFGADAGAYSRSVTFIFDLLFFPEFRGVFSPEHAINHRHKEQGRKCSDG